MSRRNSRTKFRQKHGSGYKDPDNRFTPPPPTQKVPEELPGFPGWTLRHTPSAIVAKRGPCVVYGKDEKEVAQLIQAISTREKRNNGTE